MLLRLLLLTCALAVLAGCGAESSSGGTGANGDGGCDPAVDQERCLGAQERQVCAQATSSWTQLEDCGEGYSCVLDDATGLTACKSSESGPCDTNADCDEGNCIGGNCIPYHCFDGAFGPNETGVDCGGSCPNACELGELCNVDSDCASKCCDEDNRCDLDSDGDLTCDSSDNCPGIDDSLFVPGSCTECLNPRFTGVECDVCAHAWTGENCATCPENWSGETCDSCSGGWKGTVCAICPPNWTGEDCDVCAESWTGEACDVCPSNWAGPGCNACANGWAGEACDTCSPNWTGEGCDSCANAWTGDSCGVCPLQWAGEKCDTCNNNWTGENCDNCPSPWSGDACDVCEGGWTGDGCETCGENWTGEGCDSCANAWTGEECGVCPQQWTGENCDSCANGWTGEECDVCPPHWKGTGCDACVAGWSGPGCAECMVPAADCEEGTTQCALDDSGNHFVEVCAQFADACLWWETETACEELNLCTQQADECIEGACVSVGDPTAACDKPDDPCDQATCDLATGSCTFEPGGNFAPCDDGSFCTVNEACFSGDCIGNDIGPIEGAKSTDYFTDSGVYYIDLAGFDTTDAIDGYGCEGQDAGYEGSEFSIEVASPFNFADFSIFVALELEDASLAGIEYVDVAIMGKVPGSCWPDACLFGAMMGDDGRLEVELAAEEAKQSWTLVIDGRDGFEGKVRMAVSYPGGPVEAFCANGEDDDGDGNSDCEDFNCFESDQCGVETACSDGSDNDLDGFEDCLDVDCAADPSCLPEQDCEGEADTDGDGLTACDDPDCNGVGACGEVIACEGAIPLSCFESLSEQSLVDGTDIFTGVQMPACGDSAPETFNVHKQLVYHVQLPAGCTSFTPHVTPEMLQTVYAFGPGCTEDSCSAAGYAGFGTGTDGGVFDANLTEGWIVVTAPDSDPAAIANWPFEIGLGCVCQ